MSELSYFRWDSEISEPLFEVIKKVYRRFPFRIIELLNRSTTLPKTIKRYSEITERLKKLHEILKIESFSDEPMKIF